MDVVDLNGTILPFALLEIAHRLRCLEPGCTVEILGLDAHGLHDLRCILPAEAPAITEMEIATGVNGKLNIRFQKRHSSDG